MLCFYFSPVYGNSFNISSVLGDITRDENGYITVAKATTMSYVINFNFTIQGGYEVSSLYTLYLYQVQASY